MMVKLCVWFFCLALFFNLGKSKDETIVRFLGRGVEWNATVDPPNLEGKALSRPEEKLTIFAYDYNDYTNTAKPKANQVVYLFSPDENSTRAFCLEGTALKTGDDGYIDCSVKLGFIVGESIFVASLNPPDKDGDVDGDINEIAYIQIKITPKVFIWTYIQLGIVFALIFLAFCLSGLLIIYICLKPTGTEQMQEVAKHIRDGANGFLRVQYITVGIISLPVALLLFFVFLLRPKSPSDPNIHQAVYGVIVGLSFLFGVFCSALSGCIGMFISVRTNIRVAAAALRSYRETINIAIRGGAFASFCFVSLSCFGVASMFSFFYLIFPPDVMNPVQICTVIIGFSFGASFSALFAQLGGGIYTKAADVGADIVGKIESKIPEDDVRNPAVIADLVGDNVGDCSGRGADLFESISANCFGTMILGSSLAMNACPQLDGVYQYILFPMMVLSFGMVSSFVGLFCIRVADYKVEGDGLKDSKKYFKKLVDEEMMDSSMIIDQEEEGVLDGVIGVVGVDGGVSINNQGEEEHGDLDLTSLEEGGEGVIGSTLLDTDDDDDDVPPQINDQQEVYGNSMVIEAENVLDVVPSSEVGEEREIISDDDDDKRIGEEQVVIEEEEEEQQGLMDNVDHHTESEGDEEMAMRSKSSVTKKKKFSGFHNPILSIGLGFFICFILNIFSLFIISLWCFYDSSHKNVWWCYGLCGVVGVSISFSFVFITVYYTDYGWRPTRSIAKASETGAATNVITGCAVGFESAAPSTFIICVGILLCFYIGEAGGIKNIHGKLIGGYYGIACGTMGMLSTATFILALDTFGPIADNAGGIVEMAGLSASIREITDRLDAVGNTTKALTKGYAVGTAALAGCLLFFAFLETVSNYAEMVIDDINISRPEVFVGGLLGAATVFLFVSITLRAVGRTAAKIVKEVRKQFKDNPGILRGESKPNYKKCVAYCTVNALISMIVPGLIGTFTPVLIGFLFRFLGWIMGDPLMGVTVTTGYLIVATITSVLLGMFLNNSGGAWDNAKKYVETGKHGGKNSIAHEASIVGDTVGDPFKDCAGPSLHVLIKLLATVALVIGPLWLNVGDLKRFRENQ